MPFVLIPVLRFRRRPSPGVVYATAAGFVVLTLAGFGLSTVS